LVLTIVDTSPSTSLTELAYAEALCRTPQGTLVYRNVVNEVVDPEKKKVG
jgi:hypothetical protein